MLWQKLCLRRKKKRMKRQSRKKTSPSKWIKRTRIISYKRRKTYNTRSKRSDKTDYVKDEKRIEMDFTEKKLRTAFVHCSLAVVHECRSEFDLMTSHTLRIAVVGSGAWMSTGRNSTSWQAINYASLRSHWPWQVHECRSEFDLMLSRWIMLKHWRVRRIQRLP